MGPSQIGSIGIVAGSGRQSSEPVPVLLYHDIADGPAHKGFRRYVVPPGLFDEHMSALDSAGYQTAPASALVPTTAAVQPDDRPVVYLTFDDGYRSFARTVMPALARYGMTATAFVPTAYVGRTAMWLSELGEEHRELMTWAELDDVVAGGVEVGAHGHRHLAFDIVGPRDLHSELATGRATLEDRLGVPVKSLAYPFGYHDRSVRASARKAGYALALEVGDNLQRTLGHSPKVDRIFRIRRIIVGPETTGDDLLET